MQRIFVTLALASSSTLRPPGSCPAAYLGGKVSVFFPLGRGTGGQEAPRKAPQGVLEAEVWGLGHSPAGCSRNSGSLGLTLEPWSVACSGSPWLPESAAWTCSDSACVRGSGEEWPELSPGVPGHSTPPSARSAAPKNSGPEGT